MRMSKKCHFRQYLSLFASSKNKLIIKYVGCSSLAPATRDSDLEDVSEAVVYPPVKPKIPPGNWHGMDPHLSWTFHDMGTELLKLMTLQERITRLTTETSPRGELRRAWLFPSWQHEPKTLRYQEYITKSKLVEGVPLAYRNKNVTDDVKNLKQLIVDAILFTNENTSNNAPSEKSSGHMHNLCGAILRTIHTYYAGKYPYIYSSQFDEGVSVAAFWDRDGVPQSPPEKPQERVKLRNPKIEIEQLDYHPFSQEPPFDRYFSDHIADFQIRTEKPLPQLIDPNDPLCHGEYSDYIHWPLNLGQKRQRTNMKITPGYQIGDPCEFGLLSLHVPSHFEMHREKFGDDVANEMKKGYGLVSSFLWCLSQAYYQGFSPYHELTYPLTTQTIVSDGQTFSFHMYQLNTMILQQPDVGNTACNMWWCIEDQKLYDSIENGQLVGFNDEVLENILLFFTHAPRDRGINMRPHLPQDPSGAPARHDQWIDDKVEEVVVIEEEKYY